MTLIYNEEQRLLQSTAKDFFLENAPVSALRHLRDTKDAKGYSDELWQQIAALGWASIIVPEKYGGLEFGFPGLAAVLEVSGHCLTASPLQATAVIGASALILGGNDHQKSQLLPKIAAGELTVALALEECFHHHPSHIALSAEREGVCFRLNGEKRFVLDGHSADQLIVVARSSAGTSDEHGLSLVLVDANAAGVNRERTFVADSRNVATIRFNNTAIQSSQLLGELDQGWLLLEPVLDRARIALAVEMLGSAFEVFERTIGYLKEREQFGVKIGSFQSLQHRVSILYTELELTRSVVMHALNAVEKNPIQLPQFASLAKASANEVATLVAEEAVQLHGGIGVTDELDIGLFLKRIRVASQLWGDTGYHYDRYATVCGINLSEGP
ncbi:MAG: acyl-CoA dehydrogenase family protein [Halioglobus sp.]